MLFNQYKDFIDYDWYEKVNEDLCEERISKSDFVESLIEDNIKNEYIKQFIYYFMVLNNDKIAYITGII